MSRTDEVHRVSENVYKVNALIQMMEQLTDRRFWPVQRKCMLFRYELSSLFTVVYRWMS